MSSAKMVIVRYDGTDLPSLTSTFASVICPIQVCNNVAVRNIGSTVVYIASIDALYPGEIELDPGVEQAFAADEARARWNYQDEMFKIRTHGSDVGSARILFLE